MLRAERHVRRAPDDEEDWHRERWHLELSWQMIWLTAGLSWFFANGKDSGLNTSTVASATGLALAVALSRVGLWG